MVRASIPLVLVAAVSLPLNAAPPGPEETWPGFRGHGLSGVAPGKAIPERWSTTERVKG